MALVEAYCLSWLLLFTFTDFQKTLSSHDRPETKQRPLVSLKKEKRSVLTKKLYLHFKWFVETIQFFLFFASSHHQSPAGMWHHYIKVFFSPAFYSRFTAFCIGELLPRCCCMRLWTTRRQELLGEVRDQGCFQRNWNLQCLRSEERKILQPWLYFATLGLFIICCKKCQHKHFFHPVVLLPRAQ